MRRNVAFLNSALPFKYLAHTRLRRKQDLISWVLIHPLPVMVLAIGNRGLDQLWSSIAVCLLGLLGFQALYEIGYIDNDVFTTKREVNPTLRLSPAEASFLESSFPLIVIARLLVFVGCAGIITWFFAEVVALVPFVALCAITMLAFALHNRIRNRWNVATYGLLATGRYVSVIVLAWGLGDPATLLAGLFMMPLPRTIEHASKPKYSFETLRRLTVPFERFRVAYYLGAVAAYILIVGVVGAAQVGLIVLVMFLFYRLAVLIAVRRRIVSPTVHQSYVEKVKDGH